MIRFLLNGREVQAEAQPTDRLTHVLREKLGAEGHQGRLRCGRLRRLHRADGRRRRSAPAWCPPLASRAAPSRRSRPIPPSLTRLRAAFLRHGAAQCGICTPGMLMAAVELAGAQRHPHARTRPKRRWAASFAAAPAMPRSSLPSAIQPPRPSVTPRPQAARSAPISPASTVRPRSPATVFGDDFAPGRRAGGEGHPLALSPRRFHHWRPCRFRGPAQVSPPCSPPPTSPVATPFRSSRPLPTSPPLPPLRPGFAANAWRSWPMSRGLTPTLRAFPSPGPNAPP